MKDNNLDIKPDWNSLAHFEPNFGGGAIISADGTETPITEKMIQAAFDLLIDDWDSGHGGSKLSIQIQKSSSQKNSTQPAKQQKTATIVA